MTEVMYHPWTSDKEPKPPKGWGLDAIRRARNLFCDKCGKEFTVGEQYLYSYQPDAVKVVHNTEHCAKDIKEYND